VTERVSHSGTATARQKERDYVELLGEAVSRFTAPAEGAEVLTNVPDFLSQQFDAERAELWLWDDASLCAYLTHSSGRQAAHRRDYVSAGQGAVGEVARTKNALESVALSALNADEQAFARESGLSHVSAYPLVSKGKLIAVIAAYTSSTVPRELLKWWKMYAEVTTVAVHDALATQESQKTITQLSLLFEATRLLNSTLDLAELLELILKIARTEVHAERGSVFLVDKKRDELWSIVASGLDHQEIRVPLGSAVAGRVGKTGETINVADAYTLEFFDRSFDQKFNYRTKSLLCLPIRHHTGEIVGVIQLLNQQTRGTFSPEDQDFLQKLSGHMALALENAKLHRDSLEKQRLEKELALARQIQRSLLPDAPPIIPGYELAVQNEPCFEVGGDYYDFLNLGPQSLLLVVADVEGKGVSSALVMSNLQATLRALVMHLHSLEVLTLSLNEMIYNDTKSEKFLSIFLGLVDIRRGGLHYINAGHVPPMLIRGDSGEHKMLEEGGTVIGLFPHAEYQRGSVKLNPGDILVCCTDGILEAMNPNEEEFGNKRLAECIAKHRTKAAGAIIEAVLAEVAAFSKGGTHVDDKVLMVLKVNQDRTLDTGHFNGGPPTGTFNFQRH
jgi:phosphoserine phosphatase RsbU/P